MQDELKDLNRQVLASFGQPVTLKQSNDSILEVTGIIAHELVPTGPYEQVLQEVTTLALATDVKVSRGDEVISAEQQWTIDRKLKGDGQMNWWSLHEAGA
ncbi:hypothetical protein [Endozoicomonas numazuensis]|uniref:Uncharacterized protein n=1 Tax=Endozoicomonas numazuensis TaxID=1137799 RepID=A0A081NI10_9GAMM|nr:hypothetical protein [Endozoicomonas numazuensis]KEQ18083.1 hypothetical protein GZ78_10935 [Endozoicomonas numazuensis]